MNDIKEINKDDENESLPKPLRMVDRHASVRKNEKNVAESRVAILKKLQQNNESYIQFLETHQLDTKDGHDEPQKCNFLFFFRPHFLFSILFFSAAELQRDYSKSFTELESQDNLWVYSDPYEGLREAVGQRHELLEAIVVNAQECKFVFLCVHFCCQKKHVFLGVDEATRKNPIEHLREESEVLATKYVFLCSSLYLLTKQKNFNHP